MQRAEPIIHPQCALAIKLRFERIEEGNKNDLRITFVNAGWRSSDADDLDGHQLRCEFRDDESSRQTVSVALNIQQLKLP